MTAPRLDLNAIERARAVDLVPIAARSVKLMRKGKLLWTVCPFHPDKNPSCTIDRVHFKCFACGAFGGVIDWKMRIDGITFREAVEQLAEMPKAKGAAGSGSNQHLVRSRDTTAPTLSDLGINKDRSTAAIQIFREAKSLQDTPAWAYLIGRGIDVDDLPDGIHDALRWHPRCPWGNGEHGCMVALFTDAISAEPRAIHRTAINSKSEKVGRQYLGPKSGCVIRLWLDDEVSAGLVIGEGIETVLAAATRIEHHGTMLRPAWAAGDAGNLAKLPALPGIESLTILVDNDANQRGQAAGLECSARWTEAGREVHRLIPRETGTDFNDIIRAAA